ncbi:MAG: TIGR00282 family metallophosphoesterase [Desulfitobacteriaceae bacterium]|nr:TIGR00282 family metallophosphoesterase [Desulfitobacteriaceae bacterium]MDD4752035.1 TIGR00282 family metallophosphoesterase [Desulfitobacteriaceae bacterium]
MRILFIGDIVGKPGRAIIERQLAVLQEEYNIDFTIANGENAAGGNGINRKVFQELSNYGIDVITMGNHVWDKKEIFDIIDTEKRLLRPANYPKGSPGVGWNIYSIGKETKIAVVNLAGRIYLPPLDCPFQAADAILQQIKSVTSVIIVDFHAEASSEKIAMGWYLDGRVSAVIGTHTHVQTGDDRLLKRGTAYITDVGMTGPRDSVLGVDKDLIIKKFTTQLPVRFEVASGDIQLNGVVLDVADNGKTFGIQRIQSIMECF